MQLFGHGSQRSSVCNERYGESRPRNLSIDSVNQDASILSPSRPDQSSHKYNTTKAKESEPMEALKDDLSAATLKLL